MILRFIRDMSDSWFPYKKGDEINYEPWRFDYRGEDEPTRVRRGLFVFCDGMGCFRQYYLGVDVEEA